MNNKDFVSYEIAQALNRLGFSWKCYAYYWTQDGEFRETSIRMHVNDPNCQSMVAAPNLWEAQKWLREAHGVHVEPRFVYNGRFDLYIVSENLHLYKHYTYMLWTDYESALSAGIEAALKLIETNKTKDKQ